MLRRCSCRLPTQARSIQTASTVYHASLTEALDIAIREASAPHHGFTSNDMPSQALVLLSRHYFPFHERDLASYVKKAVISAIGDDTIQVAGGIVDSIGRTSQPGVSILLCSEDERAHIRLFEDRTDRTISVGRAWKSQGSPASPPSADEDWTPTKNWKELISGASEESTHDITAYGDVQEALILAKGEFGTLDWPAAMFPKARIYGLIPTATPFLTGRAMTLFKDDTILAGGGVALTFTKEHKSELRYPRLKSLGDPLSITKASGNILITLAGQPATYTLLEQIRKVLQKDLKISKDILLFAKIQHQGQSTETNPVIKIIAGDPGKGSMALNNGYKVREGDVMHLYYENHERYDDRVVQGFEIALHKISDDADMKPAETSDVSEVFTAGSSTGLILGSPGARTYISEPVDSSIHLR